MSRFERDHRLERLLLGLFDEAAGVDDDELGLGGVIDPGMSLGLQAREHLFSVDLVLGAAVAIYPETHC